MSDEQAELSPRAAQCTMLSVAVATAFGMIPPVGHAQGTARDRPEEIIVTSSIIEQPRRQIGTPVSVIDFEDIELRGYDDLASVLRTQTGIGVTNSGGLGKPTAVSIRGEDGYRTLLIIDGVKAVDPSAPQVTPSFETLLTTSDLQRVEVLRGPQGFMYGADAGGVVNVLTVRGTGDPNGRIGLEYGELDTSRVDAAISGGGDDGDYFFSVTDLETDGFNARAEDTVLRDNDGADNTTLHTKIGWNASDNLRLQLVARNIDAGNMYDACFSATFALVHDCTNTTEQTTYKVSAEYTDGKFTNFFGYSGVNVERADFAEGDPSFATDAQLNRLEYTGSYRASDATTVVYGVDLQDESVVSTPETLQRDQNGYYVEYQGAFAESFFLSMGARYDDNDDFGSHTSTRISGAYVQELNGGNSLKYRASVGTGFRAPSLFEISYNNRAFGVLPAAAATSLAEEQSRGYDIGIEYDGASGLHFEVTYFDHELEDQITYVFNPMTFDDGYLQSPGTSPSTGIEIGVDAPLGERWSILANWTSNEAETADGQARLRRPENLANFGVRYTSRADALRFIANYRLSSDAVDFGNVRLDDYEVLDLAMSYVVNETLEVYGRIQNATDEVYEEVSGYNSAARATYAGVRVTF